MRIKQAYIHVMTFVVKSVSEGVEVDLQDAEHADKVRTSKCG